jgi:CubicO group peptidase (beta-lactamase class C family)
MPRSITLAYYTLTLTLRGVTASSQVMAQSVSAVGEQPHASIIARLERRIPELMNLGDVPGLSIALVRDGDLVWHRGFGVMDAKTHEPVEDSTVFEAASLGKPVFAYAVLKLCDAGVLDLDTPLNRYLPGTYDVGDDARLNLITARRVLSHTSGLPNWRSGALTIHFTPGERFSYSGEGYVYLSRVVEHLVGEKINDFMTRTVFEPLGMTHSSYVWQPRYDALKSSYHNTRGEPSRRNAAQGQANVAASLHTTATDYGRFLVAVVNGTGLKPETRRLMVTAQVQVRDGGATTINRPDAKPFPDVAWGLGWGLQTVPNDLSLFHWGNNGDAKAYVVVAERSRSAVAIFANSVYGLSIVPAILSEAVGGTQPATAWLQIEPYDSPGRQLFRDLTARGARAALDDYRAWRKGRPAGQIVDEDHMNRFGLDLLRMGRVKDAIEVLKQNVSDHPESFNVHDSLGEAYAIDGQRELAIRNYERSLAINPNNTDGLEALRKLRGDK